MNFPDQQLLSHVLTPPDRRRDPRHSVQVQIELREDGSEVPIRMSTTDLSRGGCYVELMLTLPIGTYVSAKLWLSDGSVRMRGRVVTLHPQFGNGIKFLEFEDDGKKVLAQYLDAINAYVA
jgi:c-di-GMP-binding flagellar brake protein YcgR